MECRPLEIKLMSARDLKDVNVFSKMDVYATASVKGDPHYGSQKQKTHVDKDSGPNPRWDHTVKFTVDEDSLQKNRLSLKVDLFSDRSLGDREIGEVHVPLKELLDNKDPGAPVSYAVRTPSGKPRGTLTFSYKFSDKIAAPAPAPAPAKDKVKAVAGEPPLAYPAVAPSTSAYGGYGAQPPPAQAYPYPYPAQHPAYGGYPPQQPAYGGYGYPPQAQQPYGYPMQQPGYGGYPPQQPGYYGQPPKKSNNGGKMAMGVGAGLLGGLLIGDMISDAGDMGGYDGGFDDGFGF